MNRQYLLIDEFILSVRTPIDVFNVSSISAQVISEINNETCLT